MVRQVKEFAQKSLILAGMAFVGWAIGFYVPLVSVTHDVEAVAAAMIIGTIGLVVGLVIGWIIIRRRFD
jgi:uncharacterized membrane protein YjfL (UPF0719 family)